MNKVAGVLMFAGGAVVSFGALLVGAGILLEQHVEEKRGELL